MVQAGPVAEWPERGQSTTLERTLNEDYAQFPTASQEAA
jgi:hypothetical protein